MKFSLGDENQTLEKDRHMTLFLSNRPENKGGQKTPIRTEKFIRKKMGFITEYYLSDFLHVW